MERNEVIKALECCRNNERENSCSHCTNCPAGYVDFDDDVVSDCIDGMLTDALSLIKELTEELTHKETAYNELYELTTEEIKDLYAERDRLTEENERLIAELAKACKALDTGKENVE